MSALINKLAALVAKSNIARKKHNAMTRKINGRRNGNGNKHNKVNKRKKSISSRTKTIVQKGGRSDRKVGEGVGSDNSQEKNLAGEQGFGKSTEGLYNDSVRTVESGE